MKKLSLFLSLLLAIGLFSGCSSESKSLNDLSETSWKLLGFYSLSNNELQKSLPEDCDDCYVLTFSKDGLVNGKTASNIFEGTYSARKGLIAIMNCNTTKVGEVYDGNKFYMSLLNSTHYSFSDTQLKLFYNNKQNYLLFKRR